MDARVNFAFGTLASGIASGASSCSVGSGEGARFPTVPFNAVIWNSTDYTHPAEAYHAGQAEIVRVTAIATDTLTITRAQEGTADVGLNTAGKTYQIWAGPTAKTWDDALLTGYLTGDVATTNATAVNVTDMAFNVGANEVWTVEFNLSVMVSTAAGMKAGLTAPVGATVGGTLRGSAAQGMRMSGTGLSSSAVFTAGGGGGLWVKALIQNGATAGTVQLVFASADGSATVTVLGDESYFVARRMA